MNKHIVKHIVNEDENVEMLRNVGSHTYRENIKGLMIHFWVPCTRLSPD